MRLSIRRAVALRRFQPSLNIWIDIRAARLPAAFREWFFPMNSAGGVQRQRCIRFAQCGQTGLGNRVIMESMAYPIKTCAVCGEEFELRPNKPGFANRCPECSAPEAAEGPGTASLTAGKADSGL